MMKNLAAAATLAVFSIGVFVAPSMAQSLGYEPARGTAERKQLLDTVRPAAEANLGVPIEFVVRDLRVDGAWAFFSGDMQKPGGAQIKCSELRDPEDCGFMDGFSIYALMSRQGNRWRLRDVHVAPTDVSWSVWPDQFGVPCALVLPQSDCNG